MAMQALARVLHSYKFYIFFCSFVHCYFCISLRSAVDGAVNIVREKMGDTKKSRTNATSLILE
jgi:hypothetical protein